MPEIADVRAREILDSRGNPTLEVDVVLEEGVIGTASVPSGASTGTHEAHELRDGDPERYGGKGVRKAMESVHREIAPAFLHRNALEQIALDLLLVELDGTANKSRLGANAMLGVSLATARAAAELLAIPLYRYLGGVGARVLPAPLLNILNGGVHADNNVDVQEFMIVPLNFDTFADAMHAGSRVYHALAESLEDRGLSTAVGDEGGFAPDLPSNEDAITTILAAIERAGYRPGEEISLALDVAATELMDERSGSYYLSGEDRRLQADELVDLYAQWVDQYPLISIEDGLAEEDWDGWAHLTDELGDLIQLVGDDLFVTHPALLSRGIREGVANAILIKPNQIGTLSETMETMRLAATAGYQRVVSHRSGETSDPFIADLAVATGCGQIKTGAPARGERTVKYNRLLAIEKDLGDAGVFGGDETFYLDAEEL